MPLRSEGIPYQLGHQTKSVARGRLLSAHSKRRELAGVEKSSILFLEKAVFKLFKAQRCWLLAYFIP